MVAGQSPWVVCRFSGKVGGQERYFGEGGKCGRGCGGGYLCCWYSGG